MYFYKIIKKVEQSIVKWRWVKKMKTNMSYFVCLSVVLCVCFCVCLSVRLSVCLSIWLSICLCAFYTLLSYFVPLDLADHLILFSVFSSILNILIPDTPSETKMAKASSWFTRKKRKEEKRRERDSDRVKIIQIISKIVLQIIRMECSLPGSNADQNVLSIVS